MSGRGSKGGKKLSWNSKIQETNAQQAAKVDPKNSNRSSQFNILITSRF